MGARSAKKVGEKGSARFDIFPANLVSAQYLRKHIRNGKITIISSIFDKKVFLLFWGEGGWEFRFLVSRWVTLLGRAAVAAVTLSRIQPPKSRDGAFFLDLFLPREMASWRRRKFTDVRSSSAEMDRGRKKGGGEKDSERGVGITKKVYFSTF